MQSKEYRDVVYVRVAACAALDASTNDIFGSFDAKSLPRFTLLSFLLARY